MLGRDKTPVKSRIQQQNEMLPAAQTTDQILMIAVYERLGDILYQLQEIAGQSFRR